jgi:hypothetical protein
MRILHSAIKWNEAVCLTYFDFILLWEDRRMDILEKQIQDYRLIDYSVKR